MLEIKPDIQEALSYQDFREQVLADYKIAVLSRECSLIGRREVLTGKAKFGIFGDGKEIPQLAMARAFKNGDFRSGYYRDQTFMMGIGALSVSQFFAGLYAHTNIEREPMSAGRQMGGHFVTHSLNEDGSWKDLTLQKNSSSDISPTASQMPRLLGLAQASKIYRQIPSLPSENFSVNGNEVAWGTIGNASTSEGLFLETFNAGGVLQIPMIISVWDDDYGISVSSAYQTTKGNISEILQGFQRDSESRGYELFTVKGWDYPALMDVYEKAGRIAREEHVPVLIHVTELTQPQGHSTSGSHERYKTEERLQWEREYDCNLKMRQWMIATGIATEEALAEVERAVKKTVREEKKEAWAAFLAPINGDKKQVIHLLEALSGVSPNKTHIQQLKNNLIALDEPMKRDIITTARKALRYAVNEASSEKQQLQQWVEAYLEKAQSQYSSHLYREDGNSAIHIKSVSPAYEPDAPEVDGRVILRDNFDALLNHYPNLLIFGEDCGKIGDVNQGLEGLQKKYGELRVADTGIREATIIGQGIGLALRGLRPIAEIQYLDYVLYALQIMSDDLATLRYRTLGKQVAPLIIRTRGHRLEGIWHAGSEMGAFIHLLRGIYVLVPRNMTQAAGFYNTLLETDEPALVVESLNGYRLKEKLPTNMGLFKTPIGVVEVIKSGSDITLVSYGSTLRIVVQVANELLEVGIDAEVIDAQTLLPFDIRCEVVKSVAKTNRLLIIDEDVPGGASAYLLQEILEKQGAYRYLDSPPKTLTGQPHRPAYGTDGDYFSKPNAEDIYECVYSIMNEANPQKYPRLR